MPTGICYNGNRQKWCECPSGYAKSPGVAISGAFLFRFGREAYALGWLPLSYLCPTICKCSGKLHLPKQRLKMMWECSSDSPPSCTCIGVVALKSIPCVQINAKMKIQNRNLKQKKDLPLSDKSFIINLKLLLWCANTERLYRFSNNQLSTNALIFVLQV